MTSPLNALKAVHKPAHSLFSSKTAVIYLTAVLLLANTGLTHANSQQRLSSNVQKLLLEAQQVFVPLTDKTQSNKQNINASPQQVAERSTAAIKALQTLELNSYEKALYHKVMGGISLHKYDYQNALKFFEQAWGANIFEASEQLKLQHTVAQLAFNQEQWEKSIRLMEVWISSGDKPKNKKQPAASADDYLILAQSYAKLEQWANTLPPLTKAIHLRNPAPESWYQLALASHQQLKQDTESIRLLKEILLIYPKMLYWEQLAATYQNSAQFDLALSTLRSAQLGGYMEQERHYIWLTQLAMRQSAPLRGAEVLESAIASGQVRKSESNLKLLANSWLLAKQYKQAQAALEQVIEANPGNEKSTELQEKVAQYLKRSDLSQ